MIFINSRSSGIKTPPVQAAKEAAAQGMVVRLRTLVPALLAYSASGNVDKAFEVPTSFILID